MKFLSVFIALVLWAPTVYAIELTEMQALALNNREVVRQFMTSLEQSEKDIVRAKGGYYPSVDIAYTGNSLDKERLTESKQNSLAIGWVSYNLFAGFRDKYNLLTAQKQKEVEQYRLQSIKQDIQLNVALAYLNVSERRANRKVAEDAFDTLSKLYQDGESRFEVGLIGKNELLKFRVDYDNADITLKAANASLEKSVNTLSRQVGSEITLADLDFAEFKELPPLIDKDKYLREMLVRRSEIKVLESLIGATIASAEAEQSDYYPTVDVVGSYSRYDDEFINGTGSDDEDVLRAQLVMSMNLFQGFTTEATVARAKLETRSVQYELAELKNDLTTDLNNLHIDFVVSFDNVEVAKRSIEQAEENLRITQLKYDEGLQRQIDLLDAVTDLSRAQFNLVVVLQTLFLNNFQLTRMIDGFTAL
ncbi:MAG: TolC family protein [Desulfobulbaceae bacterium]|nr:TolC family protein [Desulfobulbaceae bacterium]